jgi:ubiquinone biosynthesis protein COQ9
MASKPSTLRSLQPLLKARTNNLRKYHSHDHPPPPGPFTPTESLILSAATPYIPANGFTHKTLSLGARDAGYIDASTNLFPRGEFELVRWWLYRERTALAARCGEIEGFQAESGTKELGVGQKVKALTWSRLLANRPINTRWQEALALMALPSNIPPSLRELHALSDEIWYLSGDVSVDSSWYTKRASLSTIYAASELFMTTDQSTEFKDTRDFLERRFRDVAAVGGLMGSLGQWVGFTASAAVNVARSRGVRI